MKESRSKSQVKRKNKGRNKNANKQHSIIRPYEIRMGKAALDNHKATEDVKLGIKKDTTANVVQEKSQDELDKKYRRALMEKEIQQIRELSQDKICNAANKKQPLSLFDRIKNAVKEWF